MSSVFALGAATSGRVSGAPLLSLSNSQLTPREDGRAAVTVARLNGVTLGPRHRRDLNVSTDGLPPDYEDQYDFTTLAYDAFYVRRRKSVCLIGPPLLNFEPAMRRSRYADRDGRPRSPLIRNHKRFSEVWLPGAPDCRSLRLHHEDLSSAVHVSADGTRGFAGMNCAVIKSKDNDLRWIRDWAEFHVRVHGLEGLVFFDNDSTRYELDEVAASLGQIRGLQRAVVASAPFRFGVYALNNTMFLQVALLNIARLRFLSGARAVLCTDLDELVAPTREGSVFDAAVKAPLGYLVFEGAWRYALSSAAGVRHADHVYDAGEARIRNTKYCVCPGKLAGLSHWDIHGAVRGRLKQFFVDPNVEYWHCRQISTQWRHARNVPTGAHLRRDEVTSRLLNGIFADASH